jgi:hypothetical protein
MRLGRFARTFALAD